MGLLRACSNQEVEYVIFCHVEGFASFFGEEGYMFVFQ